LIRATCSSQYFATSPAIQAVPQATMVTLGTAARSIFSGGRVMVRSAGFSIECSVSPITAGCS
jgi:hypothetical protein